MPIYRVQSEAIKPAGLVIPSPETKGSPQLLQESFVKRRRTALGNMKWSLEAVHIALMEFIKYRQKHLQGYYDYVHRLPGRACEAVVHTLSTEFPDAFSAAQAQTLKSTFRAWVKRQSIWQALESSRAGRTPDGAWVASASLQAELMEKFGEENVLRVLELREPLFPFKFELEFLSKPCTVESCEGFIALMRGKTRRAHAKLDAKASQPLESAAAPSLDEELVDELPVIQQSATEQPALSEYGDDYEPAQPEGVPEHQLESHFEHKDRASDFINQKENALGLSMEPLRDLGREHHSEPLLPSAPSPLPASLLVPETLKESNHQSEQGSKPLNAFSTFSAEAQHSCTEILCSRPLQSAVIAMLHELQPELSVSEIDQMLLALSMNETVAVTAVQCSQRKTRQELIAFLRLVLGA